MVIIRCLLAVTVYRLLAVAVAKGWELHQMDVHNTFLRGDLEEKIYMKPPSGFHIPNPIWFVTLKNHHMGFDKQHANGSLILYWLLKGMGFSSPC